MTVPAVTVPTLFLRGSRDLVSGGAAADLTAGLIHGEFTQVVLDDAGHWLPDDRPHDVAEHLNRHLHRSR